jgi:ribosomal protein S27E
MRNIKNNTSPKGKGFKKLQCKYCDEICQRVDENATAITCYICVSKLVNGQVLEIRK